MIPGNHLIYPRDLIIKPEGQNFRSAENYILKPWQIPIAPEVYNAPKTYTEAYIDKVRGRLLNAIKTDIAAIKEITGKPFDANVAEGKVECGPFDRATVEDFRYTVDTERMRIDFMEGGASLTLQHHTGEDEGNFTRVSDSGMFAHPMEFSKMARFFYPNPSAKRTDLHKKWFASWKTHNPGFSRATLLVFRSFAMETNNLYFDHHF